MKIEKLKENATPREILAFYEKCITHIENGGIVSHFSGCEPSPKAILEDLSPSSLTIHYEEPEEYVPYDSTTAQLIPCNAWVRRKCWDYDLAIQGINRGTGEVQLRTSVWESLDPKLWSYSNSPVNGELAGKPFGVKKGSV